MKEGPVKQKSNPRGVVRSVRGPGPNIHIGVPKVGVFFFGFFFFGGGGSGFQPQKRVTSCEKATDS